MRTPQRIRRCTGPFVLMAFLAVSATAAHGESIAFLVAEIPGRVWYGDSYVLLLEDPAYVQHARDLIEQGIAEGGTIIVASIAAGADGVNRDVRAPGEPEWSWHITQFERFADSTAEVLDGGPSLVESDVSWWITNTGGRIGFWNYTVVSELPEPRVELLAAGALTVLVVLARERRKRLERWR